MQISSASMFASLSGAAGISSPSPASGSPEASQGGKSSARSELDAYLSKSPAEKMHAAILAQMGVSEDAFQAMNADQRAALEEKIKAEMQRQMEASAQQTGRKGLLTDMKV